MAAGRTLVVMEGGHPWGFRIEGGAEVREPLRINKVLGGGKAYYHGIEVGDILSSINGEKASNMTISRARHLVRTSDDLLVLEVTRPIRGLPRIPEIRVISPNENLNTNGRGFQWGPNEVPESQRYMVGTRSTPSGGGSLPISKVPPMPPPKPARRLPLTARNPLMRPDPMMLTYPVSASQAAPPPPLRMMIGHGRSPAVASGNASVVDDGTTWSHSQPTGRQSTRSATPVPRGPNQPGKWTFTLSSPPSSPRSGEVQPQRRNTEPAPIKPGGLSGYLIPGRPGVVDKESFGTWKTDPLERKEFRRQQRTTDSGSVDRSLSSTAVVLPLSSRQCDFPYRSRTPVSENLFAGGNRFVAENPYDLLPNQEMLNLQGQNQPVHYQNSYNKRNLMSPSAMPQLEKSWSQKIEDFETGYHSSASHDDSNMYADYDFLPEKPMHQNNLRNSPRENVVLGDRTVFKDPLTGRGDQLTYPDKRFGVVTTRQKLDEEKLRRKLEIERVIAEEKRRRYLKDLSDSMARRHSDNFTPLQRSSLLMDRFSEDDEVADALARPVKRVYTKIRGKARALHAFRAQSYRELSFRKNDIIYILRQVDKNWFEGERHGMVGIFPITYVEVLTSLDEARATAEMREGTATAIYHFRTQTDRELPLRKGDVVTLIRRVDENWYEGRLGRRQGIFPVTYVETHREPETPMTTPMSSHAPTPLPGTPASCTSPVSSLYSVGPEIPSAPMSPLGSEFYESDWDTASIGALQTGRPMHTSRSSSPARSQMSDREVTPVQGAVSPFYTGPANRYAYEGHRVQGRSLPPKPSMLPYSQMADRDITPVRGVTSPTPTGSANTRYSFEGGRIVNQSPGSQPKPASLAYNEFSDHEITPVREVTSPTPTGSGNARFSFDGTRIVHESPSSQVKPSSLAYDRIDDHEITPVREVTSPTPTGSANARYSLDRASIINPNPSSQLKISYYRISEREAMPERSVTSPPPTGSANARYSIDGTRLTNQGPSLQPKPSSVTFNQISDREIMRVRGVTSPPIGSPIERYSDRMAPQNGPSVQSPSLQSKPSLHSYSQISDREVIPVREVTSPTPTGSVLTRYSIDEAKTINESPGLQPKPSSLAYNKISDREIMRVRGVTSPPPIGSPIEQYSDRTAPQNGPRVQSSDVQLKSSTVPESQVPDGEITPVRGVISPTPMVSASAQYPSDGTARSQRPSLPLKPSALPQSQIPDRDMTPVKAVVCPSPTGSPIARVSYEDSKLQKPSIPAKPSIRPSSQTSDQETTPVRAVVSPSPSPPTPIGSANTRLSSEESKIQNPDSQQKSAVPSELEQRKAEILDPTSVREIDKRSDSMEQTRGQGQGQVQGQGKSSGVSVDKNSTSVKPVVATKRPPSGRSASLTLRALKQKLPFFKHQEKHKEKQQQQQQQQPPTEGGDRRDDLSKSPGTKNPYLRCRAVYDYKPQNIDELEVLRGDIIYVMEKCADGWFVGISEKTKKFGSFPGNFVRPA